MKQTLDDNYCTDFCKEKPMLENTSWVKVSKQCHTLVDEDCKVLAVVFTSYSEDDGDENFIWDVEIDGEEFGSYVSLYCAKLAVQKSIAEFDAKVVAVAATQKRSKVQKKKKVEKKSAARK
jgi:hypothetical protein